MTRHRYREKGKRAEDDDGDGEKNNLADNWPADWLAVGRRAADGASAKCRSRNRMRTTRDLNLARASFKSRATSKRAQGEPFPLIGLRN